MTSCKYLDERDLCVEKRIVDIQPQAQLKEKHYTLPQIPATKHLDYLDRAIMRAALHPGPSFMHNKRARSIIFDDKGDSTFFNSDLPMIGAHSSMNTEATDNLQVTEPPLETELPQKFHLLAPKEYKKRKMTSSKVDSL
jgi:hypothetical protein